jgi:site-specific DNA-methyltransferase (adenine-specific)
MTVKQDDKFHLTGKPTQLMRELVKVAPVGGRVLDPFCGSGTTGAACIHEGRLATLIETSAEYVGVTTRRLTELTELLRRGIAVKGA